MTVRAYSRTLSAAPVLAASTLPTESAHCPHEAAAQK